MDPKSISTSKRILGSLGLGLLILLTTGCTPLATETFVSSTPEPLPTALQETATILPKEITNEPEVTEMKLTSPAFENNGEISNKYAYNLGTQCNGENYSPPLTWSQPPAGTRSLLLTMIDPDGGDWVHWLLFNIPPETTFLDEVVGGPAVGLQGRNDFGELGYGGPCPPSGMHHYIFTLYALDSSLEIEEGASLKAVIKLIEGHVLAQSSLTGLKSR